MKALLVFFSFFVSVFFAETINASNDATIIPEEHRRGEDQTYLTLPEWNLVHSPDELADFLVDRNPSEFPYWGHIKQFWDTYDTVHQATKDKYEFNAEYHTMIGVIGVSTTVEYGGKGIYEKIVGRLTEVSRSHGLTEEDKYSAKIAREYVDFIEEIPWYEFDYWGKLKGLWSDTSFFGKDFIRKVERKYILTSEYGFKAIYGWLIKKATQSSFEKPISETYAVVTSDKPIPASYKTIKQMAPNRALISLPRYFPFTQASIDLAAEGIQFEEIAGNKGVILVSLLVKESIQDRERGNLLLRQPILTKTGLTRMVYEVDVAKLSSFLYKANQTGAVIEHVYDY